MMQLSDQDIYKLFPSPLNKMNHKHSKIPNQILPIHQTIPIVTTIPAQLMQQVKISLKTYQHQITFIMILISKIQIICKIKSGELSGVSLDLKHL